ncbi:SDR family NAD(P)-dependent oxidoreductase [Flavitalea sp.]|nr:SDR family oxidoreductase [Flavitalea sp.]
MLLENKVVLVTGGAQGIGLECAKAYVAEGAMVAIVDKKEGLLEPALNKLGSGHLGIYCNVSIANEVQSAIQKTLEHFGKLDAIHNNAGIAHPSKALHDTTEAEWDELMNVNLKSVFLTTKFGITALKNSKGCILNTSSLVGEIGQELHAAYSSTKGAMNALTRSMALDYAADGVRVNAVAPAGVWTPMLRQWNSEQALPHLMEIYLQRIHPLGYCPEADVVASACVFLLSDMARFITGCILPVSGGAELGYKNSVQG